MKAFYKLNPLEIGSGAITPEGFIEYVIGEEPEELNEAVNLQLEETRVQNINTYTQSFIYSKYSQPKQSSANLGVYDEAYKQEMVTFIKRIVDLSNEAITNGTSFEDYKAMLDDDNKAAK